MDQASKAEPLTGLIRIADYDSAWPLQFEQVAAKIRSALGGLVLRLEHVGSTAVPGLPAKPIIDIVLEVADSARESEYAPALESAGYELRIREPEWYEHRMFRGSSPQVNLHVFSSGCPEVGRMLRFRDHLRTSQNDRELYASVKRDLARRQWKFTQDYADAKTAVVQEIMSRACA